jgi:hypothetical protein
MLLIHAFHAIFFPMQNPPNPKPKETNVAVPADLLKKVRLHCDLQGLKIKHFVKTAITLHLPKSQ